MVRIPPQRHDRHSLWWKGWQEGGLAYIVVSVSIVGSLKRGGGSGGVLGDQTLEDSTLAKIVFFAKKQVLGQKWVLCETASVSAGRQFKDERRHTTW